MIFLVSSNCQVKSRKHIKLRHFIYQIWIWSSGFSRFSTKSRYYCLIILSITIFFRNEPLTRCKYSTSSSYSGPLLPLMQYHTLKVAPDCPNHLNCTCGITYLQEGRVSKEENRVYSVKVYRIFTRFLRLYIYI